MKKIFKEKMAQEYRDITKYIFEGLTINQISEKMKYSNSTISTRINNIFKKYGVKNRLDFIMNVVGDILDSQKNEITTKEFEIQKLNDEIQTLKKIIENIAFKKHIPENKRYWLNLAKQVLTK